MKFACSFSLTSFLNIYPKNDLISENISFLKIINIAIKDPKLLIVANISYSIFSGLLLILSIKVLIIKICPLLDTGIGSVIPCIIPKIT